MSKFINKCWEIEGSETRIAALPSSRSCWQHPGSDGCILCTRRWADKPLLPHAFESLLSSGLPARGRSKAGRDLSSGKVIFPIVRRTAKNCSSFSWLVFSLNHDYALESARSTPGTCKHSYFLWNIYSGAETAQVLVILPQKPVQALCSYNIRAVWLPSLPSRTWLCAALSAIAGLNHALILHRSLDGAPPINRNMCCVLVEIRAVYLSLLKQDLICGVLNKHTTVFKNRVKVNLS